MIQLLPDVENIVSISGGKDSAATLAVAIAKDESNISGVFADTGHEHPLTIEYVAYLNDWMLARGLPAIRTVRADFAQQIAHKRIVVATKWRADGVPEEIVLRSIELLKPTGIPFLDLCIWKGRFPSTRARFCSEELKRNPIIEQVQLPLMEAGKIIVSWQGVRADESENRRYLPECDEVSPQLYNYRPILRWTVADVFEALRYMGIKPNPLYTLGMGRVGCMPCIHARKDELLEIGRRFPEEFARVAEWERIVSLVSKRGNSTFFEADTIPGNSREIEIITHETHGIWSVIEWSKTARGGRQYDMFRVSGEQTDGPACSSIYGLCE